MNSLAAKLNLAWNMVIYLCKLPFRGSKTGSRQFLENYAPDRLLPLSSTDKTWLLKFSACFNCGFCDTACPALKSHSRDSFPGPSYLLTTFSRSMPDFPFVDVDASVCEGCDECARVCPNQVPVREALEYIEAKQRALGGAGL